MIEVWKTIEHFGDGHFLISNEGNIKKSSYEFRDSKVTRAENMYHARVNDLLNPLIGANHVGSKKVQALHYKTGQLLATFESIHIAAIFCNAEDSENHIAEVCNGKRDYAFGYKWRYVEETVTTNK